MFKKILKAIGAVLLLLIIVVLFNTFTYKSKQLKVEAVASAPVSDNCVQHLSEAVKIKTVSYVVLDTELPKVGKRNSRWSIQQNLETDTIKSAIYT